MVGNTEVNHVLHNTLLVNGMRVVEVVLAADGDSGDVAAFELIEDEKLVKK